MAGPFRSHERQYGFDGIDRSEEVGVELVSRQGLGHLGNAQLFDCSNNRLYRTSVSRPSIDLIKNEPAPSLEQQNRTSILPNMLMALATAA